jgi:hypothetical protein
MLDRALTSDREMERLYRQNRQVMRRNEKLAEALRGLISKVELSKKTELEELIRVRL